jgi:hypothetical protein
MAKQGHQSPGGDSLFDAVDRESVAKDMRGHQGVERKCFRP